MANQMDSSIDMGVDAIVSFSWRVDSMIRSETGSNLGESPLPSFGSRVDGFIRSRTPSSMSNFGTYLLQTFPRLFTLSELQAATKKFSLKRRIGIGNTGFVYRGKLNDGREVAIKRGGAWSNVKTPCNSGFAILSRLPQHEHLVGVVGLCQEKGESLLVYEYMKNGSLYDNLHDKYNSVLSSWKMRIKIALDVCRGIQYLLDNTVPHVGKVIKSSNILLDETWTGRVSDLRLMFMNNKMRGVDCIHPKGKYAKELTEERDVYGLGVVLLELLTGKRPDFRYLTGKRPDFRYWDDTDTLLNKMGLTEPSLFPIFFEETEPPKFKRGISYTDLMQILDLKVGPPNLNETKALHLVHDTALKLITAKDRPTMPLVVLKLEQALAFCEW